FEKHVAKAIAEEFSKEEHYVKFERFLDVFDELSKGDILNEPRFGKKDALGIALKRVGIFINHPSLLHVRN
ncbi:MAG: hypothetical protein OEL87_03955, partial [Nanoarchaeota archaeon]|nr:hypothetical protein [Nanoarchaeota archaeon]